jgi:hypothetical protein
MALAALLEAVEAEIGAFDGVSSSVESDELRAAVALRERAEALMLLMAGAWDHTERWRADGHLSAAAALRADGMPSFDATRTVRSARLIARNERLAKTLAAGDLTADHVATMARHVGRERVDRFDEHADALIDGACTLNADDTTAMMRRWASHVDDLDNRGEPDDIENKRGVWAHRVGDAMEGRFLGHPDDIAALLTALDRMQPPDPKSTPGGARTLAQRRYDALMDLAGSVWPIATVASTPPTLCTSPSTPRRWPAASTPKAVATCLASARSCPPESNNCSAAAGSAG